MLSELFEANSKTMGRLGLFLFSCLLSTLVAAVPSRRYKWNNVKIGGGGGFVPGIVFNPKEKVRLSILLSMSRQMPK